MKDLSLDVKDYNLTNILDIQRFLMVAQAELLNSLSKLEEDFPTITELITKVDISTANADLLKSIDNILHPYIEAFICVHVYYQQLLKIRDIITPDYWPAKYYSS